MLLPFSYESFCEIITRAEEKNQQLRLSARTPWSRYPNSPDPWEGTVDFDTTVRPDTIAFLAESSYFRQWATSALIDSLEAGDSVLSWIVFNTVPARERVFLHKPPPPPAMLPRPETIRKRGGLAPPRIDRFGPTTVRPEHAAKPTPIVKPIGRAAKPDGRAITIVAQEPATICSSSVFGIFIIFVFIAFAVKYTLSW